MVMWPFSTPTQQALSICGFIAGLACVTVGIHLSYANIAPQQARTQARKEYVRARLRKILDN